MDEYSLITHPNLKNLSSKYEKLLINNFLNFDGNYTSFKFPESEIIHNMPLDEEMKYNSDLKDNVLLKLSELLNREHGVNYSNRYWKIILGHYVEFIINVTYERWISIKKILENYNIKEAPTYEYLTDNGFIEDVYDFGYMASYNDDFNHYLYSKAIEFQTDEKINNKINENSIDILNCLNIQKSKFIRDQKGIKKQNFFRRISRFVFKNFEDQKKIIRSKLHILYSNCYLFSLSIIKRKIKFVLLSILFQMKKDHFYRKNGEPN